MYDTAVKLCEENFISWCYWNYKPYGDHTTSAIEMVSYEGIYNSDGTVQNIKEKGLSRGYVMYYQGRPLEFKYDKSGLAKAPTSIPIIARHKKNQSMPSIK